MLQAKKKIRELLHVSTVRQMFFFNRLINKRSVRILYISLICIGIASVILMSFDEMAKYKYFFNIASFLSAFIFTVEYIIRIYIAPICSIINHRHWLKARIEYMTSFMGLIDFIAILPFTVPYLFGSNSLVSSTFELGRIILIFKLFRYSNSFNIIQIVLRRIKSELFISFSFIGVLIGFSATLMYYIERAYQPEQFENIADGVWWAIATFTTVGYGDIYPISPWGKVIAGASSIIGLISFALPTALVSGSYMDYLQDKREQEKKKIEEEKELLEKKSNRSKRRTDIKRHKKTR